MLIVLVRKIYNHYKTRLYSLRQHISLPLFTVMITIAYDRQTIIVPVTETVAGAVTSRCLMLRGWFKVAWTHAFV